MSNNENRPAQGVPGKQPDTTILHLDKLAPGAAPAGSADESVTSFIAKAAAETISESSVPVVVPKEVGTLPPESMLGAVSYCYSKGVYSSKEIGRKMAQDPVFRASCQSGVPRPEDILRFRRLNREAILKTLEKALRFAEESGGCLGAGKSFPRRRFVVAVHAGEARGHEHGRNPGLRAARGF